MAVRAQYPSNALFLSRNNGQESHEYSFQPQPGGFLDQSQMLFSNEGMNNPRKRGREEIILTPLDHFPMNQSHPSQIADLSQLHSHGVSTGLRLSSGGPKEQDYHSSLSPLFSDDFASLINHQGEEIEEFILSQAAELRRTLAEQRKKHCRSLLSAAEESATRKLAEKDAEVEKATRRNAEYEARVAQVSLEAQVWRARAKAQASTAAALQAQLQKAMLSGGGMTGAQDTSGGGGGKGQECAAGEAEDAESGYVDPKRNTVPGPRCKGCRRAAATVVLLPCRHLCVCRDCERLVRACPVCLAPTDFSVEVHFS